MAVTVISHQYTSIDISIYQLQGTKVIQVKASNCHASVSNTLDYPSTPEYIPRRSVE